MKESELIRMIINNTNKNDRFFNVIINQDNLDPIRYYDILTLNQDKKLFNYKYEIKIEYVYKHKKGIDLSFQITKYKYFNNKLNLVYDSKIIYNKIIENLFIYDNKKDTNILNDNLENKEKIYIYTDKMNSILKNECIDYLFNTKCVR